MGAQNFNVAPKFYTNESFQSRFWAEVFRQQKDFTTILRQPNFLGKREKRLSSLCVNCPLVLIATTALLRRRKKIISLQTRFSCMLVERKWRICSLLFCIKFLLDFSCTPTAWLPDFVHWRPSFFSLEVMTSWKFRSIENPAYRPSATAACSDDDDGCGRSDVDELTVPEIPELLAS